MPLYDWFCPNCGSESEMLCNVPFTNIQCNHCHALMTRRLAVPAPPIVKGHNAKNGYSNKEDNGKSEA